MSNKRDFLSLLKRLLHDPVDKPFDIKTHEQRAKEYAEMLGITGLEEARGADWIASSMERSLLPPDIKQEFNEIRHPLSEEKILVETNGKGVIKDVKQVLEGIKANIENLDARKKFFYLWRNLPEIACEKLKAVGFGKYMSIIPADTRVPDHSLWEHLKITSAVNAFENLQNNSLFLYTIGPVQSFISQARKTQDLLTGSFLLSYLTFVALEKIIEEYGPTSIIYPDLGFQPLMDWYLEEKDGIDVRNSRSNYVCCPTIPNRFVAIIPLSEEEEIKELVKGINVRVRSEWNEIVNKVLKKFKIKIASEKIENQTSYFPQIYWVCIPWRKGDDDVEIKDLSGFIKEDEINKWNELWNFAKIHGEYPPNIGFLYQLLYTALEKSMGARKNLRGFTQTNEEGRKCSVCGEKDVIFFWESKNKKRFTRFNPSAIDLTDKISHRYFSDGEGLCSICFIKRTLERYLEDKFPQVFKKFAFPSTAEVSLSDFKEKTLTEAANEFEEYTKAFKNLTKGNFQEVNPLPKLRDSFNSLENLDGEWFFEENLTENAFKKYLGVDAEKEQLETLKEKLKKITNKVGKPNSYFAVLILDGDDMRKWLSGERLPGIKYAYNSRVWETLREDFKGRLRNLSQRKLLTPAVHSAISTALRNYSIEFVRKIVEEEYLGKLVYTGGDDVLALVNLRDLFQVMQKLRFAFSGQIKFTNGEIEVNRANKSGFVERDGRYLLTMGKNATLSAGVVIAHYKMPLRIVLKKAREMEKKAKEIDGKDAFAIALLKRSGEERVGKSKWYYPELDVIDTLNILSKYMVEQEGKPYFSDKFIYTLRGEFSKLKDEDGNFTGTAEIFNNELKRLLSRAYNGPENQNEVKKISNPLREIFWKTGGNMDNFLNLLEISAFINREARE